jgi:hypothetical protein
VQKIFPPVCDINKASAVNEVDKQVDIFYQLLGNSNYLFMNASQLLMGVAGYAVRLWIGSFY